MNVCGEILPSVVLRNLRNCVRKLPKLKSTSRNEGGLLEWIVLSSVRIKVSAKPLGWAVMVSTNMLAMGTVQQCICEFDGDLGIIVVANTRIFLPAEYSSPVIFTGILM